MISACKIGHSWAGQARRPLQSPDSAPVTGLTGDAAAAAQAGLRHAASVADEVREAWYGVGAHLNVNGDRSACPFVWGECGW